MIRCSIRCRSIVLAEGILSVLVLLVLGSTAAATEPSAIDWQVVQDLPHRSDAGTHLRADERELLDSARRERERLIAAGGGPGLGHPVVTPPRFKPLALVTIASGM
jgi:hypothetical protein